MTEQAKEADAHDEPKDAKEPLMQSKLMLLEMLNSVADLFMREIAKTKGDDYDVSQATTTTVVAVHPASQRGMRLTLTLDSGPVDSATVARCAAAATGFEEMIAMLSRAATGAPAQ